MVLHEMYLRHITSKFQTQMEIFTLCVRVTKLCLMPVMAGMLAAKAGPHVV